MAQAPCGVTLLMTNPAIFGCRGPGAGHGGTVCSSWPRSAEGSHQQCANTHHVPPFSSPPRGCVRARASLGTGGENKQPCYFVFCLNISVSAISNTKGGKEKVTNKSPQQQKAWVKSVTSTGRPPQPLLPTGLLTPSCPSGAVQGEPITPSEASFGLFQPGRAAATP